MKITREQAHALGIDTSPAGRAKHASNNRRIAREKARASFALFDAMCKARGLPEPIHEYLFAEESGRKWRFDHLFDGWLALEVQGGNWTGGRHVRAAALKEEYDKLNAAVALGYSVIFCTPEEVESGAAFALVERILKACEDTP